MKKTITVVTKNDVTENDIHIVEISLLEIMEFKDNFLEIYTEEDDAIFLSKQVVSKVMEAYINEFGI